MPASDDRYRVHSVERAIAILEILASEPSAQTVTELAEKAGGSKSATFATVHTLIARGLIRATGHGQDRRYSLGLGLARLGDIAVSQVSFRDTAIPLLRSLSSQTGLTARAAAWGGDCTIAIARVNGTSGLSFDLHMGDRESLHCTSAGKAMLSALDPDSARAVLARIPLDRRTHKTLVTVDAVDADLRLTRSRGYAVDDEEDADGIMCIGAAVLNHSGEVVGALSVTGIRAVMVADGVPELGATVAEFAARLSRELGWIGDSVAPNRVL